MNMYGRRKRYCIFGCEDLGAPMHGFPHPVRRPELFRTWMTIVGNRIQETNPMKIHKNKKICDHHFRPDQKSACHRLIYEAVPSVNFERVVPSSCILEIEHNYCFPNVVQQFRSNGEGVPSPAIKDGSSKIDSDVILDTSEPIEMDTFDNDTPPSPVLDEPSPAIKDGSSKIDSDVIDSSDPIETDTFDNDTPPSPVLEFGQTTENNFSWQTEEFIEADAFEDPTPVAEEPKSLDEAVTLSLFCDAPDPPIQPEASVPEPSVAPEDVKLRCKSCAAGIEGYSFWCVQCACGRALCGACACAAGAAHARHYVLRAPGGATQNQTQALLAVLRQQAVLAAIQKQLLMEKLLEQYDTRENGVEVKEEPAEPASAPTLAAKPDPLNVVEPQSDPPNVGPYPDPLNVGPHPDPLNVGPHHDQLTVQPHSDPLNVGPIPDLLNVGLRPDPLNLGPHPDPFNVRPHSDPLALEHYEAAVIESVDPYHPYKRPRLMHYPGIKPNSTVSIKAGDFPQELPNVRRGSQAVQTLTPSNIRSQDDLLDLKTTQTVTQIDPINVKGYNTKETVQSNDLIQFGTFLLIDPSDLRLKTGQQVTSDAKESQDVTQVTASHVKRSQTPKCVFERPHSSINENSIRDYMESDADDSDLDKDYRIEEDLVDEDTDDTDVEDIAEYVSRSRRTRNTTNIIRGPSEVMLRSLTSEAAVQLQPLTSLEIRMWIHRNTRRKD